MNQFPSPVVIVVPGDLHLTRPGLENHRTAGWMVDQDLALTYRSTEDRGPVVLITHPSDLPLATGREHIVSGLDWIRVRVWPIAAIRDVRGRIDGGEWFSFRTADTNEWVRTLDGETLAKGEHKLEVEVIDDDGLTAGDEIAFQVDLTGRFTPVPGVWPVVKATAFC